MDLTVGQQFMKNMEIEAFQLIEKWEAKKPEIDEWAKNFMPIDSLDEATAATFLKAYEAFLESAKNFADKISPHVNMGKE